MYAHLFEGQRCYDSTRLDTCAVAFVECVLSLTRAGATVMVVLESRHPAKGATAADRQSKRDAEVKKGNWTGAIVPPDCLIRRVCELLTASDQLKGKVTIVYPPCDFDSQACYLCRRGICTCALVWSNDSDFLLFPDVEAVFNFDLGMLLEGQPPCPSGFIYAVDGEHCPPAAEWETCDGDSLRNWSWGKRLVMGVLSGCDYYKAQGVAKVASAS